MAVHRALHEARRSGRLHASFRDVHIPMIWKFSEVEANDDRAFDCGGVRDGIESPGRDGQDLVHQRDVLRRSRVATCGAQVRRPSGGVERFGEIPALADRRYMSEVEDV